MKIKRILGAAGIALVFALSSCGHAGKGNEPADVVLENFKQGDVISVTTQEFEEGSYLVRVLTQGSGHLINYAYIVKDGKYGLVYEAWIIEYEQILKNDYINALRKLDEKEEEEQQEEEEKEIDGAEE